MTDGLEALDVLRRVTALYSAITSYSDTGQVLTRSHTTGRVHRTTFETLYQKPSLFRFTFSRPHPHTPLSHLVTRYSAGHDGKAGYSVKRSPDGATTRRSPISLETAVAAATGISSGAAHTIGQLLLPELRAHGLLNSLDARLETDVVLGGKPCYVIATRGTEGEMTEQTWIEKDSFVLRKVMRRWKDVESEETRENVAMDTPLDQALFAA